ncbi:hypothetical protein Y1Q_0020382 [Alligator mississippiensis]|uniref:Uncharacterized protein n=1 Tax=Alligator mississippiensis TaxID=8496 RepID=A0A151N760_ALLMI|nr:hypothetical protein Y1Q_0020382 [Alligator mississippiensis]
MPAKSCIQKKEGNWLVSPINAMYMCTATMHGPGNAAGQLGEQYPAMAIAPDDSYSITIMNHDQKSKGSRMLPARPDTQENFHGWNSLGPATSPQPSDETAE